MILQADEPMLRKAAEPVERFDRSLRKLYHRLLQTMYDVEGVGLAAPQIGVGLQLFVYDDRRAHRGAIVNPTIEPFEHDGEEMISEGCLSVGQGKDWRKTARWIRVAIHGFAVNGKPLHLVADHYPARIFQHETDHLAGVLFTDRARRGRTWSLRGTAPSASSR